MEEALLLVLLADQRSCQVSHHPRHESENAEDEKILGAAAADPHLGYENEEEQSFELSEHAQDHGIVPEVEVSEKNGNNSTCSLRHIFCFFFNCQSVFYIYFCLLSEVSAI